MSTQVEVIPVFMPEEEAKRFILFNKHYVVFNVLAESGVFDQKKATILLDFDHEGTLQNIRREDYLFSRKFDKR